MNLPSATQNLESHWLWVLVKSHEPTFEDHILVYTFFTLVVLALYVYSLL